MYIFKTSGETLKGVLDSKSHAFHDYPKGLFVGEIALISKNIKDCKRNEPQINYYGKISSIREENQVEFDRRWPGNNGRWKYLIEFESIKAIRKPFNMDDLIHSKDLKRYKGQKPYNQISPEDELVIRNHIFINEK